MKLLKRILLGLLGLIVTLVIVLAIALPILQRRSYPQVDGGLTLPGLDAPVEVYRDEFGIPQIYASTQHDLFMAQGFVQAQDRFWQMDFWRHQAVGRLSELLGENTLEIDQYLQTLGWERVAMAEWELLDPDSRAILQAFTDGVNAYMGTHTGSELSYEYSFLPIINPGYEPAPWQPHESLAWGKAMAWDLRGNMGTEIDRALLLAELTPEEVALLFPAYDFVNRPVIVNDPHLTGNAAPPSGSGLIPPGSLPPLARVRSGFDLLDSLRDAGLEGIGSNSWVIGGDLTATGKPLLANDPHLGAQLPSIWYEVGLHCVPKSADCLYEVTGFAFSAAPGVIIGHNDQVAWGFTNLGPDVMDLYIEKINPDNPNQYEVNGEWVEMELVPVTLKVAGGDDVDMTVRYTRHGPILSDVSLEDFGAEAGIDLPENFAISLRWTALEPGYILRAVWKLNRAQNWDSFRDAAADFNVPSQNLVYADVDGNIGYQTPGWIPIRQPGHDGMLPVPGWTDEFEWQGYIPFNELPFAFNPPEGYIVTANNAVVGPEYPYTLSLEWDYGYRAQSIVDAITSAPGPIDSAYIQQMQANNRDMNAERLMPFLLAVPLSDEHLEETRAILADWDFQADMDSAPAALFEVFWKNLLHLSFGDNLPDYYQPWGGNTWFEVTGKLVDDPGHPWWDDVNTAATEDRDAMFALAFAAAVTELEDRLGDDPAAWAWGDLHTLTLEHDVMSSFPGISALFNRGPFRAGGGSSIVNATGWSANGDTPYIIGSVPSMRMIIDLGNLQNSLTIHLTGQSGHAGHPHYADMTDLWRLIEYHVMHWELSAVEAAAESHLTLTP